MVESLRSRQSRFGPDGSPIVPSTAPVLGPPKTFGADEFQGHGVAVYDVSQFRIRNEAGEPPVRRSVDTESQIPIYTSIRYVADRGAFSEFRVEHHPKPERLSGLAQVMRDPEGEPTEILPAVAFQRTYSVELRYYQAERLMMVFQARDTARQIVAELTASGLLKAEPIKFDLRQIAKDPNRLTVFNAWVEGSGNITSEAYFGHDVLDDPKLKNSPLRSIKVHFRGSQGMEDFTLFVSMDGRISHLGGRVENDHLVRLFRDLQKYRVHGPQTTLSKV